MRTVKDESLWMGCWMSCHQHTAFTQRLSHPSTCTYLQTRTCYDKLWIVTEFYFPMSEYEIFCLLLQLLFQMFVDDMRQMNRSNRKVDIYSEHVQLGQFIYMVLCALWCHNPFCPQESISAPDNLRSGFDAVWSRKIYFWKFKCCLVHLHIIQTIWFYSLNWKL